MAKINIGQILMIAAVVQAFVTNVKNEFKGTSAQKKAAVIKAVREALPVVETLLGKDLLDDAKFNAAISALVEAVMKAPAKTEP